MKRVKPARLFRIRYFWGAKRSFISAWVKGYENASFGWEWGYDSCDDPAPIVSLNLFGLAVIHFQRYRTGGFMLKVLGFWWIR
jgi:hypothetical protein